MCVLKLCIFFFFIYILHCVIVFASFLNCVLRVYDSNNNNNYMFMSAAGSLVHGCYTQ